MMVLPEKRVPPPEYGKWDYYFLFGGYFGGFTLSIFVFVRECFTEN